MFEKFKNFTSMISQTRELQNKAKELDQRLKEREIEMSSSGFYIKINCKKEILELTLPENIKSSRELKNLINNIMKKADDAALEVMKSLVVY